MARSFSFALAVCAASVVACSSALPMPRQARQPRSQYFPVPYPPPAAFAETVPRRPDREALWIDGHWAWRGGRFVWQRGGWVRVPPGARYAQWRSRYSSDGTLLFAEEAWYDSRLQPIAAPTPLVEAYTPPNELTPESLHGF